MCDEGHFLKGLDSIANRAVELLKAEKHIFHGKDSIGIPIHSDEDQAQLHPEEVLFEYSCEFRDRRDQELSSLREFW